MLISNNKKNLIVNSLIEIDEAEGNGKGHYFKSRFIEAGVAHYDELGDILITKETLTKFIDSMIGCPVIINHKDVTDKNVDKLRVGVISRVWYEPQDGWFYCEGVITDEQAVDLIKNQGWNVSCSYNFVSDNTPRIHNGKKIDMEFTNGEFLHLAIVENPRYEGANIVVNSVDNDDDTTWITMHGNHIPIKKGQSKEEAVKEFLDKQNKGKYMPYSEAIERDKKQLAYIEEKLKEKNSPQKHEDLVADKKHLEDRINYYQQQDKKDSTKTDDSKLSKGDSVYLKSNEGPNKRIGKITKQISDDVVEVEFEAKGNLPARTDRYYIDELSKDKSEDSVEKEDKKYQNEVGFEGQLEFKKQYKKEFGSAPFYFDGKQAVDEKTDQKIKGATLGLTKEELTKKINEHFNKNKETNKKEDRRNFIPHTTSLLRAAKVYGAEDINVSKDGYTTHLTVPEQVFKERETQLRKILSKNKKIDHVNYGSSIDGRKSISIVYKKGVADNNIGDITMTVLNELKDFIMNVVNNEKEEEMKEVKNEDKRKLIDEVGGILKGKVDEEVWRTVVGKLEKIAYKPSEDDKADNEIEEEEKEEKVTENEDEEKEEKFEEEKEIANKKAKNEEEKDEEEVKNKCGKTKNSIEETKEILFGGVKKEQKEYLTRDERIELGNEY